MIKETLLAVMAAGSSTVWAAPQSTDYQVPFGIVTQTLWGNTLSSAGTFDFYTGKQTDGKTCQASVWYSNAAISMSLVSLDSPTSILSMTMESKSDYLDRFEATYDGSVLAATTQIDIGIAHEESVIASIVQTAQIELRKDESFGSGKNLQRLTLTKDFPTMNRFVCDHLTPVLSLTAGEAKKLAAAAFTAHFSGSEHQPAFPEYSKTNLYLLRCNQLPRGTVECAIPVYWEDAVDFFFYELSSVDQKIQVVDSRYESGPTSPDSDLPTNPWFPN